MVRLRTLALNTTILTVSSLAVRCIAMAYRVWLAGRIGAAGVGLFQLVASVELLGITFAVSGIRFTTTRLVSEEIGLGNCGSIGRAVNRCCAYALFFGVSACMILVYGAEPIGFLWIGDARTVLSLRIIALCMPFISLSSVFGGYFVASGKVYKTAAVQILEQLINIFFVAAFLSKAPSDNLEYVCAGICSGTAAAEGISFALVFVLYILDNRAKSVSYIENGRELTFRMLKTAVPLALSAYARTSLSTLQDLLVPRALRRYGLDPSGALSGYGAVMGMVFPIIGFPSCLLTALAEVIVPVLTGAQMRGDKVYIKKTIRTALRWSLLFSLLVCAFIFLCADSLGALIYKTETIGGYIRVMSLIIPVMYLDHVVDGCLKGLGQMMHSMAINIADALLGVILVPIMIPRFGISGYLAVIYITEVFNFSMSILRLRKAAD